MSVIFLAVRLGLGAPQISPKRIEQLEVERGRFFRRTHDLPGSGYTFGAEGSHHEIIFPIGRSDVLYYVSEADEEEYDKKTKRATERYQFSITKWRAEAQPYQKVWQLAFHFSNGKESPKGTLLSMASYWGFRPNRNQPAWPVARRDLERVAPFALYRFGEHGDVALQSYGEVHDAQNRLVGIESLPIPEIPSASGGVELHFDDAKFIVLPAEVKLINAGRGG